jgi:hypothetical protein
MAQQRKEGLGYRSPHRIDQGIATSEMTMDSTLHPVCQPRLRAAASEFEIAPEANTVTDVRTGAKATEIVSGLKTTVTLLEDGETRVCLITTHFGPSIPVNVSRLFRETIADDLGISVSRVLLFTSHNHCSVAFAANGVLAYNSYCSEVPAPKLLPIGEEFLATLRRHVAALPARLEAVTVWRTEGCVNGITYHRKGRRADGTTYFVREEDRQLLGDDYQGDVDSQAPLIVLKNEAGRVVAGLAQFTGHPVTAFHPEKTIVFGEWPQVACDLVSENLGAGESVPVGFLQGCAGDVNSKELLSGKVALSKKFGEILGAGYCEALNELKPSRRDGLAIEVETVKLPLAPLPPREELDGEMEEMTDFIRRAEAGDEDTLLCVGQNFPRKLSPKFRAWLVGIVKPWNEWALDLHEQDKVDSVPIYLELEIAVVGLPCEPFQNIGRQIRSGSPFPLTIPCGYLNVSHGYITDSENTGDGEYMSAHYRYTKFRPPLAKPAGDVLADAALRILKRFSDKNPDAS